jgi:hypothetical protein
VADIARDGKLPARRPGRHDSEQDTA